MDFASSEIFRYLAQFAYEPLLVYGLIILLMTLSSFGLPFPEEVTLLSAGLLVFMGRHPDLYPPPYPGAPVVSLHITALVCFLAVFLSDYIVFMLGRKVGSKMLTGRFMQKMVKPEHMTKVSAFTGKYGAFACGIFRFTPGIRFPGHFACGSVGIAPWKFILVDGTAALVSVPTQVYLMGLYGEVILGFLKEIKLFLLYAVIGAFVFFLVRKFLRRPQTV